MNISDVSKKIGLTTDTLRYYEREGLIPPINRDKNGYRDYTEYDLNWIYFVSKMRKAGVSIESIIKYNKLFMEGREETAEARKDILRKERTKLEKKILDLRQTLDYLNYKIDNFDNHIRNFEKMLDPYIKEESRKNAH